MALSPSERCHVLSTQLHMFCDEDMVAVQTVAPQLKSFLVQLHERPDQEFGPILHSMISYMWCKEHGDCHGVISEILRGMYLCRTSARVSGNMLMMVDDLCGFVPTEEAARPPRRRLRGKQSSVAYEFPLGSD